MSADVVNREEVETMMWTLADILVDVREIHAYLIGDDDDEAEEADT